MGAAGRDFHDFNVVFRDDPSHRVVGFTAAQIPDIANRRYPPALSGPLYPDGLPIHPEEQLARLVRDERIDRVYLCYSDLSHADVMHKASIVLAAGASFGLLGPKATMLSARVPVVSVGAVRTGAGKSALARHVGDRLRARGHRVVAIRHPMPYGDLERQAVQRFATHADLEAAEATIEEREEYEPWIALGVPVYAGVDYARILEHAQQEAEVLVWDGGNNDFPFLRPDLHLVLLDAHRPGHELAFHPGETNLRMADVLIVGKAGSAPPEQLRAVLDSARAVRPDIPVLKAELQVAAQEAERIAGRRVVIVGDGPTLTHGGMSRGAGTVAAERWGAAEIVDPRPWAVGAIERAFRDYPHLDREIPAMGYGAAQVRDLAQTLRAVPADLVLDATPVDLARLLDPGKPMLDVSYRFEESSGELERLLQAFAARRLDSA